MRTRVEHAMLSDLEDWLCQDGYEALVPRAREIRIAAERGCLLWTKERLTTTDLSQIDARPST